MMPNLRRWGPALGLLVLVGCASSSPPFVSQTRTRFDTLAPEYRAYVATDARLSETEKKRRLETLQSWDAEIRAAEAR
jgi:hypothetical protein